MTPLTFPERVILALLLRPGCDRVGCREVARLLFGSEDERARRRASQARDRLVARRLGHRCGSNHNKVRLTELGRVVAPLEAVELRDGQIVHGEDNDGEAGELPVVEVLRARPGALRRAGREGSTGAAGEWRSAR